MEQIVRSPLNWQAGEIEDTQTEIKVYLKKAVLNGLLKEQISQEIEKIIQRLIDRLESQELKIKARESLIRFSNQVYTYIKNTYGVATSVVVRALLSVAENKGTPLQREIVKDFYEKTDLNAYNISEPLNMYSKDYMDMVAKRMDRLADIEAKDDYSSRVTLRNIAEMQVRFERNMGNIESLRDKGVKLVWILPHANCSERCQRWQGKLYSLDGTSGTIDGIPYQPIENAMNVYETTRSGKIYRNGCLSGFNCRHQLEAYKDKNKPSVIPSRVIERTRDVEHKQRYLENMTRKWKERYLLADSKESRSKARLKALQWAKIYREFSKANNMPYYESRIKVI